jgi:hypothetical protein
MDNYVKVFFTNGTDIRIDSVDREDTNLGINFIDKNGEMTVLPLYSIKYIVLIPNEDLDES